MWHALQVTVGHEHKVEKFFLQKPKIEDFVIPKETLPGYVFIKADLGNWPDLSNLTTYHKIVGEVSEEEVRAMVKIKHIDTGLKPGDRVEVLQGSVAGQTGEIVSINKAIAKVLFFFFGREVILKISVAELQIVEG